MPHGGLRPNAGRKKANHTLLAEQGRQYIIERVHAELKPIMDKAIEQAKEGDVATRKDLLDRAHGRPTESLELTGKDGAPLNVGSEVSTIASRVYKKR